MAMVACLYSPWVGGYFQTDGIPILRFMIFSIVISGILFGHVVRPIGRLFCWFVRGCKRVSVIFSLYTAVRPFLSRKFLKIPWGMIWTETIM